MPIHAGCSSHSPGLLLPSSFPALQEIARGVEQWSACRALLMPIVQRQRGETLKGSKRITNLRLRAAVLSTVKWVPRASLTSALQRLCHERRQAGMAIAGMGSGVGKAPLAAREDRGSATLTQG